MSRAAVAALRPALVPALPDGRSAHRRRAAPFSGSWSATGQRQTIPTEGGRAASIVRLSGSLVLTGGSGSGRGFRGEAIGFDDGAAVRLGVRCGQTIAAIGSSARSEASRLKQGGAGSGRSPAVPAPTPACGRVRADLAIRDPAQRMARSRAGQSDLKGRFRLGTGPP